MKNKLILISPFVLIIVILLLFFSIQQSGVLTQPKFAPTPTQIPSAFNVNTFTQELFVQKTYPENNQENVPVNQKIIVYLNKKISIDDIKFFITPDIPFNIAREENNVVITPTSPFESGTMYTFSLNYKLHPVEGTFEFTTTGPTPSTKPDTTVNIKQIRDDWNLANHPDLYLFDQTPYEAGSFSITGAYSPQPTGHYYFMITVKTSQDQAKIDFVNWAKSLGLTDQQLNTLDIRGLGTGTNQTYSKGSY